MIKIITIILTIIKIIIIIIHSTLNENMRREADRQRREMMERYTLMLANT